MTAKYRASFEGHFAGTFQPIRFNDGRIGYQSIDEQGRLYGILWDDGIYGDPHRNGNLTWEFCEETDAHRSILELAGKPWQGMPIKFREV